MTRTTQVAVNSLSNCLRFGVNTAVMLVLTPVLIHRLGHADFGIWSLAYSVLGFFMLLDFGLDTSVVKWVGHCKGRENPDRRNRVLSTVAAVYGMLALAGTAAIVALSFWFADLFGIPPAERQTATTVIVILGVRTVLLGLPLSLFRATLFGEQQIWQINIVQAATAALYGAAAIVGLCAGMRLIGLAWLNLAALVVEHACYIVLVIRYVPGLRLSWTLVDRRALREVLSFSAYQFAINVSGVILLKLDPIIVSVFMPLSAVAIYAVALKIAENLHLLTKQGINVLAPLVAQLEGEGATDKIRRVLINATKFLFAGAAVLVATVAAVGGAAITCWVGPSLADAGIILVILTSALALSTPQITASTVLAMTGHHRVVAVASVLRAVINVAVSIALVRPVGLPGVAIGTLVATVLVDWGLVVPFACRVYRVPFQEYARRVVWPACLPGLAAFLVPFAFNVSGRPTDMTAVLFRAAAGLLVATSLFGCFGLEPVEKQFLRHWLPGSRRSRDGARATAGVTIMGKEARACVSEEGIA